MPSPNPTTQTQYRRIPRFPFYAAGDDGSIWSRITGRWRRLRGIPVRGGYLVVNVRQGKGQRSVHQYIHLLVLEAFRGPCPVGMEACHDPDPCRTNNSPSNLRWDTHKANMADSVKLGRIRKGSAHPFAKVTEQDIPIIRQLAAEKVPYRLICERFGISLGAVSKIVHRTYWAHVP